MDYGDLFGRGWGIIWSRLYLLALGFLAVLGAGTLGGGRGQVDQQVLANELASFDVFVDFLLRFIRQNGPLFLTVLVIGFAIGIPFWLLRLVAQGGLIAAVARHEYGESFGFGDSLRLGLAKLPGMIGLHVVLYGPVYLISFLAVVGAVFYFAQNLPASFETEAELAQLFAVLFSAFGLLCVASLCVIWPLWIFLTTIYAFAQRGLVLSDLGIFASTGRGWLILRRNFADIFLLLLLYFLITAVVGIFNGIVAAVFVNLLPLANWLDLMLAGRVTAADFVPLYAAGFVQALLAAAVFSIWTAVRSAVTTLAYNEFVENTA